MEKEKCKFCGNQNKTVIDLFVDEETGEKHEDGYLCLECVIKVKKNREGTSRRCDMCGGYSYNADKWYRRRRIEEVGSNEFVQPPRGICDKCYSKLSEEEKPRWPFESEKR